MLKIILIVVLAILVVFLGIVAVQPSQYRVVRGTSIQAPPAQVFSLVNDFHNWTNWSPWAKLDPSMKTTYSGSGSGPGSVYEWVGNDQVGQGRMTITGTTPPAQVDIKLEFLKPFPSESLTTFQLRPEGAGTHVEWIMSGENGFIAKMFMMFMGGMDGAVGKDFEKGLAQMKALAEQRR
ncbi:MAG: SRPBCC family protein [Bryobacteraceae bacterium]|nr:SRPBCC family protein [Bryobacteraceae bacterium]